MIKSLNDHDDNTSQNPQISDRSFSFLDELPIRPKPRRQPLPSAPQPEPSPRTAAPAPTTPAQIARAIGKLDRFGMLDLERELSGLPRLQRKPFEEVVIANSESIADLEKEIDTHDRQDELVREQVGFAQQNMDEAEAVIETLIEENRLAQKHADRIRAALNFRPFER